MRIDEGLDTGDILLQKKMEVRPEDSSVTLAPRLAELGADLLVETMRGLAQKQIIPIPQDNSHATLAPILKKEDGLVDFSRSAVEILNRLRGFQPWPGAYTQLRGKNLKIITAQPAAQPGDVSLKLSAGEMQVSDNKLLVGCGTDTVLQLLQVQPEGKKPISARDFISGYRPTPGERLG
jgi:methionyl-tRNA formyltransferase